LPTLNPILSHIHSPEQLEKLYRADSELFRKQFEEIYPQIEHEMVARVWFERLNYKGEKTISFNSSQLIFVGLLSILAWGIMKIPSFTPIKESFFYPRNIGFGIFPFLIWYFSKQSNYPKQTFLVGVILILSAIYINFLPDNYGDSIMLACIHLVLFQWCLFAYAFTGFRLKNLQARLEFLRYNGDLIVLNVLILLAGGLLTALTIGMFHLIGMNIEKFYQENIVVYGLFASPLIATLLIQTNQTLVHQVAPLIAKIFTPLVIITLIIYLGAFLFADNDPFHNRDNLMLFNGVLIAVMAIIFFSLSEKNQNYNSYQSIVLVVLSVVTILINGIALSAIIFRIGEWGITPNRLAVLGGNVLILTNLILVCRHLIRALYHSEASEKAGIAIARYIPVYAIWTLLVMLIFPVMFGFR